MDVNVFRMCQVRASSSSSLLMGTAGPFNSELPISVGTAGPQLRAPDLIGHGPCRTSTARARPQLQAPDLSWRCRTSTISVGTAGPRLRAPDLSGPCRISTASSGSQLARWTSTASAGSRWALTEPRAPYLSGHCIGPQPRPDLSAHCRTSTVSCRSEGLPDELETSVCPASSRYLSCRTSTASARSQRAR